MFGVGEVMAFMSENGYDTDSHLSLNGTFDSRHVFRDGLLKAFSAIIFPLFGYVPSCFGQIYISELGREAIGVYSANGQAVNANLVTGLSTPTGINVSGSNIYIANYSSGTVGVYTTSGAVVNASLLSGLSGPVGIAVSGSNLFVSDINTGKIGLYTTSGTTLNANLITGLQNPYSIAVSG